MKRLLVTLLVPLLFVSEGLALSATFTDEVGRTVEVNGAPRRIVSVAPNVTEILFAMGLEDRLVGVSTYCQYPPDALQKEKIGGYINPSLEKIVALRPDLVVGIAEGDLKTFVDKLASLNVPVYITNPRDALEVMTSIQKIGEVTFAPEPARRIVRSMEERVRRVQDRVQGRPRPRVLHILDFNPLISAGKGTFVDDLIRLGGGRNVAEAAVGKYPRFSMEEILLQDPEVILLASMKSGDPLVKQRRWWQRWKTISAVKQGRIYVLDSDLIHRPSPRMVEGLEQVARAIHPEAFP
ncbi:MAG: cobalamin-binding protein [Syntrophaceae bacterium]|nr:cobalamin-binding protein [Syntrophaceae bacterium]